MGVAWVKACRESVSGVATDYGATDWNSDILLLSLLRDIRQGPRDSTMGKSRGGRVH